MNDLATAIAEELMRARRDRHLIAASESDVRPTSAKSGLISYPMQSCELR